VIPHPLRTLVSLVVLFALSACASKTASRMGTAATAPLNDLNIIRADIPDILIAAQQHPYLVPVDGNCAAITAEIQKLDEVLGADLDAPASDSTPSLLDRGGDFAEDQAVGAVQRTAEGLIPFRGWIRKLSGAERYSKKVAASITAGSVRRGFLKGFAASEHCPPPTPLKTASADTQH
jgi:hypothetical protein